MGAQTKTRETFVIFRQSGSGRVQGKGTREQPLWDGHAAFMDKLFDAGKVMLAGPYADGSGALVIVEGEDENEARHIFDADPWVVADILTAGEVKRWHIFLDSRRKQDTD